MKLEAALCGTDTVTQRTYSQWRARRVINLGRRRVSAASLNLSQGAITLMQLPTTQTTS